MTFVWWLIAWLLARSYLLEPCAAPGAGTSLSCFLAALPPPGRLAADILVALAMTTVLPVRVPRRSSTERPSFRGGERSRTDSYEPFERASTYDGASSSRRGADGSSSSAGSSRSDTRTERPTPRSREVDLATALSVFGFASLASLPNACELRKSYKRLCLASHPDRNGGTNEKFCLVAEAYRLLQRYAKDAA